MRFMLLFFGALLAAVGIAWALNIDRGYVLLSYGGWSVELSLASFVVVLVLAATAVFFILRAMRWVWRLPRRLRELYRRRRQLRARRLLTRGLIEFAEGRWREGEKKLVRSARDSETPLINYLSAARAAQLQKAHERRDNYLRLAYEETPAATIAVLLTQAELQIAHKQYEHAQATLKRLQEIKPGHAYGLKLLARLNNALGDWNGLEELLPRLRKSPAMTPDEIEQVEIRVLQERMKQLAQPGREEALKALWQSIPRRLRHKLEMIRPYVKALLDADAPDAAESMIRDTLKWQWDDELVIAYGRLRSSNAGRQLARVEAWLKEKGDSAALLLTAGRLCTVNQLWGKARAYLQTSIMLGPRVETYDELGHLFQNLGQPELAMEAFKSGLELNLKGKVSGATKKKRSPRDTGSMTIPGFVRSSN